MLALRWLSDFVLTEEARTVDARASSLVKSRVMDG
jgi:hypothetical protein